MINDITYTSGKYKNSIKKITKPLFEQFGISHFGRGFVSSDGHWNVISNDVSWLEYAAESKCYLHDPCLVDPIHYQSGVVFSPTHENADFQNHIHKVARDRFDIDHALVVINKKSAGCEFIIFATSTRNTKIMNTYITKLPKLHKFIEHVNAEISRILHAAKDYSLDLKIVKSESYFGGPNVLDVASENNDHFASLPGLTQRELQCLKYYWEGKTAKETAKILNLSFRTIEEYIDALKTKLNCRYKRDLLSFQHRI